MDKNIIIAGAGHGGLSAAYNLAKAGYNVRVFEKSSRNEMGHDWLDVMSVNVLKNAGFPPVPDDLFTPYEVAVFHSPFNSVSVGRKGQIRESLAYVDRKRLIDFLISNCIDTGVDIQFDCGVKKAIFERNTVKGIELDSGEKVYAPLVIDACGMNSPVRQSLPVACGIQKKISSDDTFFVYRAYFNKLPSEMDVAKYNIHFFHCNKQGLDWVIQEPDAADLLIGGFGKLTDEQIEISVADFRQIYDMIGEDIVRGGQVKTIPVRKPLSNFICNGYAAVGDSASMVEPLSGSGINLSIKAGYILADTIIGAATDRYSIPVLWNYLYRFFREDGNFQLKSDVLKKMLTSVTCDDIEYLFVTRFLTDKELGGSGGKYSVKDLLDKVKSVVLKPSIVPALTQAGVGLASIKKVCEILPDKYDAVSVRRWMAEYDKL